jgi:hypothetical protein
VPRSPQDALQEAINCGAAGHWCSGGAVLVRKWGFGGQFDPFKGVTPNFANEYFEWQISPTVEYPTTPEAMLRVMQATLLEADHTQLTHDGEFGSDRQRALEGLDLLATKLGLTKNWNLLAQACFR